MLNVKYFHQKPNFYGNVMWDKELGQSDKTHPVTSVETTGNLSPLEKIRSLGYYASCFPEGDGMAINDESGKKSAGEVASDLKKCFNWEIEIHKGKPGS